MSSKQKIFKLEQLKIKVSTELKKNRVTDTRVFQKINMLKNDQEVENYRKEVNEKITLLKKLAKKSNLSKENIGKTINQAFNIIYGNIEHIYKEVEQKIEVEACRKECLGQIKRSSFSNKEELYYRILSCKTKFEILSILNNLPELTIRKLKLSKLLEKNILEEQELNIKTSNSIRAISTNMKNQ